MGCDFQITRYGNNIYNLLEWYKSPIVVSSEPFRHYVAHYTHLGWLLLWSRHADWQDGQSRQSPLDSCTSQYIGMKDDSVIQIT